MNKTRTSQHFKKIKLLNSSQMDPLSKIDDMLHSLIFQHLTSSDVLRTLEVSREWNQLITKTKQVESKVQLSINETWNDEFNADILQNSNRKYTSVKVNTLLRSRDQVFKIFCNFAEFLVTVNTRFDFEMNGLKLPSVKSLTIKTSDYPHFFEEGLLSSVSGLVKLEVSGKTPFPKKLIECLESNPGLLELVLEDGAEQVFKYLTDPVDVKLKVLKMNKTKLTAEFEKNFVMFLSTQIESLQELKLLQCDFLFMCKIFNHMKNLKRLTFSPSDRDFFQCINIEPHPNLEELNLILVSPLTLQAFLSQTPKLKSLYISDPTFSMFKFILVGPPEIKEFRFAAFRLVNATVNDIIDAYEEQKAKSQLGFNNSMKIVQI